MLRQFMWLILATLLCASSVAAEFSEEAEALEPQIDALMQQTRIPEALELAQRQMAIRKAAFGESHVEIVASLNVLAQLRALSGNYAEAADLAGRSVAMAEETAPGSLHHRNALHQRSVALFRLGDHEGALLAAEAFLVEAEAVDPLSPAEIIAALNDQSNVRSARGEAMEARALLKRALGLSQGSPAEHRVGLYTNLARLEASLWNHRRARELYEDALALGRTFMGPEHPTLAVALSLYADTLAYLGLWAEARAAHEEAIATFERGLGPDHPYVANARHGLGVLSLHQGDYDGALQLVEPALALLEARLKPGHGSLVAAQSTMASILSGKGRFDEARVLLERALQDLDAAGKPATAARLRAKLGALEFDAGDARAAQGRYAEALEGLSAMEPVDVPALVNAQKGLARLAEARGDWDEATALLESAIGRVEEAYGPAHHRAAEFSAHLARVRYKAGDSNSAVEYALKAGKILGPQLDVLLPSLSERERLALLRKRRVALDTLLDVGREGHEWLVYGQVLRWKGAARDAARLTAANTDERLDGPYGELVEVRADLARLGWKGGDAAQVAVLHTREEALERELGAHITLSDPVGVVDLCAALPKRSVLVDFVRFKGASGPEYSVFVLSGKCDVHRVDLGPAEPIDSAIASWREIMAPSDDMALTQRVDLRGARVREGVWEPLEVHLRRSKQVIVVPDGSLAVAPLAALPMANGRYWIEEQALVLVEQAGDLVRAESWRASDLKAALLVGGLDYGEPDPDGETLQAACGLTDFEPLPGTGREVSALRKRLASAGVDVRVLSEAGETLLEQALPENQLVHLATHGFFGGSTCVLGDDADVDPMWLSGLALSQANRSDVGLWTAREVAGVDLRGTRLVVLSACETGLGEVRDGEGVLGLRRALSVAGVPHQIMSLSAVGDEATTRLMDALYTELLDRGSSPAIALRAAQLSILARNRSELDQAQPQDWAGFVAIGAPGP